MPEYEEQKQYDPYQAQEQPGMAPQMNAYSKQNVDHDVDAEYAAKLQAELDAQEAADESEEEERQERRRRKKKGRRGSNNNHNDHVG